MKKLVSLLLAVLLCFSACSVAFAGNYKAESNNYPTIMISGYSSSSLRYFDEETGDEIHAWGNTGDQINMALEQYKEELILAAAKFVATGDISPAVEVVGTAFNICSHSCGNFNGAHTEITGEEIDILHSQFL